MIVLRIACLMAGILVLVVPGMLFPNGAVGATMLGTVGFLVGMLLAASSFFTIALIGHRIKRAPQLRHLCALLLAAPLLAGVVALWRGVDPVSLWMSGWLIGFTLIVYLVLMYPLLRGPSARRLRAREGCSATGAAPRIEPQLKRLSAP